MADLLKLSSDVIDGRAGTDDIGPLNRINFQLSEIADGVAMVEAFSHSVLFSTDEGLVVFDTSSDKGAGKVIDAIRHWSTDPFHSLVYTHGHVDHVGGCGAFLQDATDRGHQRPRIIGHENVKPRLDRYNYTNGYNLAINQRQFGSVRRRGYDIGSEERFLPTETAAPDLTYQDKLDLSIGGLEVSLTHAKGETDDHTWSWIPSHKAICAGDFLIWAFPNAGNPQKVQRYPAEWAAAMRAMARKEAELFLPAHGLPIAGKDRIASVLNDVASALEFLVQETVSRMNAGATLDAIVHEVKLDKSVLEKPFMQPTYDEPEFVIRNIWRLYGGWYDGNPAHLKPPKESELAAELAQLAGGAVKLAERALALSEQNPRLACQLAEFAVQAEPLNRQAHEIRAQVYQYRRGLETSLMAKGIFGSAANESSEVVNPQD
ncbi:MAG: MBL fold metallo-hydrolase [Pseudomonadales bacterium]|nr:MBL fold metallo-hydrolase [Pseudomonadales bacterium]